MPGGRKGETMESKMARLEGVVRQQSALLGEQTRSCLPPADQRSPGLAGSVTFPLARLAAPCCSELSAAEVYRYPLDPCLVQID